MSEVPLYTAGTPEAGPVGPVGQPFKTVPAMPSALLGAFFFSVNLQPLKK